ncbi:MAG: hypothetical protein U1E34_00950 [Amaricoccus sp.]
MATKNENVVAIQSVIRFGQYVKDRTTGEDAHNSDGKRYAEISVGRQSMLPTWPQVHDYGCRTATSSNAARMRRVTEGGEAWDDDKHRDYYVGSYRLSVERLASIRSDHHSIAVWHHPEEGLPEHCNIEIVVENEVARKQLGHDRTEVIADIQSVLEDPNGHVCDYDRGNEAVLSKISLEVPLASNIVALNPPQVRGY